MSQRDNPNHTPEEYRREAAEALADDDYNSVPFEPCGTINVTYVHKGELPVLNYSAHPEYATAMGRAESLGLDTSRLFALGLDFTTILKIIAVLEKYGPLLVRHGGELWDLVMDLIAEFAPRETV